jgi:6-phosphogluconolactonase
MNQKRKIIIADDPDQLAVRGAELFCKIAREATHTTGRFRAAISGGSTPRAMNRLLAREPVVSRIAWRKTHLFWVDERMVPADDPASNFGAAREDFLEAVPLPPKNIHPMTSDKSPPEAAADYQKDLKRTFRIEKGNLPVFDLIFLGIGQDGHTASIFPGDQTALATDLWVVAVKGGNPDVHRLTLTRPVLNNAATAIFLISGKNKAGVVKTLLAPEPTQLPARKIKPVHGELTWLLDRDAAALLPPEMIRK